MPPIRLTPLIRRILLGVLIVLALGALIDLNLPVQLPQGLSITPLAALPIAVTGTRIATVVPHVGPHAPAQSVIFATTSEGFALGRCANSSGQPVGGNTCTVLRTTDGGGSWLRVLTTADDLQRLQFLSPSDGFAYGMAPCTSGFCPAVILATQNGGQSWQVHYSGPQPLQGEDFVNAESGFAVQSGALLRTFDGGVDWSVALQAPDCAIHSVSVTTNEVGLAAGGGPSGPCLYATADGGSTWKALYTAGSNAPLTTALEAFITHSSVAAPSSVASLLGACSASQVDLTGPSTGWLEIRCDALQQGALLVLHTTDGGGTWHTAWSSSGCPASCGNQGLPLFFLGHGTAWRLGQDSIDRTSNSGSSFAPGGTLCAGGCVPQVDFLNVRTGYAATPSGLFATADGGKSWRQEWPSSGPGPLAAFQDTSGGAIFAVPQLAPTTLLVRPAGSSRWQSTSAFGGAAIAGLDFLSAHQGYVWTVMPPALFETADGGHRFRRLATPVDPTDQSPVQIRQVDFVNPQDGWLLGFFGQVWRTTNGGKTWSQLPAPPGGYAQHLAFSDVSQGFLAVLSFTHSSQQQYTLLHTADGGLHWTVLSAWPYTAGNGSPSLSFISPGRGWLLEDGSLVNTTDSGRTWTRIALSGLSPYHVQFVSRSIGFILTVSGSLYATSDGGRLWVQVS